MTDRTNIAWLAPKLGGHVHLDAHAAEDVANSQLTGTRHGQE